MTTSTVVITSYGLGHRDAPQTLPAVVVDTLPLRNPPEDPAARQQLTRLTGPGPDRPGLRDGYPGR